MSSLQAITGYATDEGTERYKGRFTSVLDPNHYRRQCELWFSSLGVGTYLGDPSDETDILYEEAIEYALMHGLNVVDTAINYRAQRSERLIGRVLSKLVTQKLVSRDEIILSTKAGFLPFDSVIPSNPDVYFQDEYMKPGILKPGEIAQGCHAMTPAFLENQMQKSLNHLCVETIDVFYLHNPETQLLDVEKKTFIQNLRIAFEYLEEKVKAGKIRFYGTATWNGYRTAPENREYLSLEEILLVARQVGGPGHHFKFVQLPYNIAMPEAWVIGNQKFGANHIPLFHLAKRLGITVMGSGSLLQGKLASDLPAVIIEKISKTWSSAQCAIQFARSGPSMTTALLGMKQIGHVDEALQVAKQAPIAEDDLISMFQNV